MGENVDDFGKGQNMQRIEDPDRSDAQAQYRCRVADEQGHQGTANIYVAYHPGCQPNDRPEDTVLPHWTIYGWVAWDKPPVAGIPLPPSDSYGSPTHGSVINAWAISAGFLQAENYTYPEDSGICFASAKAARHYIERKHPMWCLNGQINHGTPITIID